MKVLIGITTYNRASILSKAIQSALDQNYPNKDVAVFDDASTDDTSLLRSQFPTVRWHRANENRGYLAARNQLMRETDADLYFSLDDDAWFIAGDEISIGVRLMEEQSTVAALAYDVVSPDSPQLRRRERAVRTNVFIGCGHLLRLSAVREVGYYSSNPGNYGAEESDLCVRLLDRKYEIMQLAGVHVWHDKSSLSRKKDEQYSSAVCNDLAFALRRYPFPIIIGGLPAKLLSHFRFAIRDHLVRSYLAGVREFLWAAPAIVNARKPVSNWAMLEFRRRSRRRPLPAE